MLFKAAQKLKLNYSTAKTLLYLHRKKIKYGNQKNYS